MTNFATVHLAKSTYLVCGGGQSYILDGLKNTVVRKSDSNVARESFSLALSPCKRYVFAIGGVDSHDKSLLVASVERYTIETDSWETVTHLDAPLVGMSVATLPDGIYILGGFDPARQVCSKRVIRLDPQSLSLEEMTEMRMARSNFTASTAASCSQIYAVGGLTDNGGSSRCATETVERYDVRTNRWDVVAPMVAAREKHAACLSTILSDL